MSEEKTPQTGKPTTGPDEEAAEGIRDLKFSTKTIVVSDNEYWNYCDNCGTRLQTFRCRYVCPKCGFFHSCSEP